MLSKLWTNQNNFLSALKVRAKEFKFVDKPDSPDSAGCAYILAHHPFSLCFSTWYRV
jgi:hypothetical protein